MAIYIAFFFTYFAFLLFIIEFLNEHYDSDSKLFSQAASRWRMIGHLLKIPLGSLDSIGHDHRTAEDALSAVLKEWSRTNCSPYSWKTILNVLAKNAVGHRRLADDIARRLSGEIGVLHT